MTEWERKRKTTLVYLAIQIVAMVTMFVLAVQHEPGSSSRIVDAALVVCGILIVSSAIWIVYERGKSLLLFVPMAIVLAIFFRVGLLAFAFMGYSEVRKRALGWNDDEPFHIRPMV